MLAAADIVLRCWEPVMTTATLTMLAELFPVFHARFAPYFYRQETRERSASYLQALLRPVERKNGWQLAEAMGEPDPDGAQRLLYQARWDAEAVRDELQRFVMETLGEAQSGILVVDETGFLKKGTHSVGVARQYSGTAGKIENCQIAVMLSYASCHGATFLDRRLYLPQGWAADAERRQAAGVPAEVTFQSKPQLARAMLEQAFDRGVTAGWVTADCVYGSDGMLRRWLAGRRQPFVLEVRSNERVWAIDGQQRWQGMVAAVTADLPDSAWQRLSVGDGTKGPRDYDWAWLPVTGLRVPDWNHWLLARRSLSDPAEVAWYLVDGPPGTTLEETAVVAGKRWTIESCLEEAKGQTGLDQYEVRSWQSWQRHTLLALLAHAFLAWSRQVARAAETGPSGGGGLHGRADRGQRGGGAATVAADAAACAGQHRVPPGMVNLAPPSSMARTLLALPTTHHTATADRMMTYLRL